MRKIFYLQLVTVLFFAFSSCSTAKKEELIIISVNDMHGEIDRFPALAALLEQSRNENPNVLLLSAGDLFSGNPAVDMYPLKGYPIIQLMNELRFDLNCFGNHEFDYGQDTLNKRIADADFDFICANLDASQAVLNQPKAYKIINVNGKKIAILGLLNINPLTNQPETLSSKLNGINFFDPFETASKYSWLKDSSDVFIVLSHLGLPDDSILALQMPEIDLIIGGHSHIALEKPAIVNGVPILQAQNKLKFINKTSLKFSRHKLKEIHNEFIAYESLNKVDTAVLEEVAKYNQNEFINRHIGYIPYEINGLQAVGSLMTDAITSIPGIDFAFINCGGIRIEHIPAGDISAKEIYTLDPFNNSIMKVNMRAADIRRLISTKYETKEACTMPVSGLTYTVFQNKENPMKLDSVALQLPNGKALNENKTYQVGLNSYITTTYLSDMEKQTKDLQISAAENLVQYINQQKNLDYRQVERVNIATSK